MVRLAQSAHDKGEYGDDRVDWLEDESWTVAFGPVLFSRLSEA